ncbi:MAG: GNAT family N-acetyltransferase [Pseudomonadales bacterium]|nr:GNAT family N-acetyltransferase [Pseudomonadales bacterium]
MNTLTQSASLIRRGEASDETWLFNLFKTTMRDYIDAAWGWEELLQKEGFVTSLPAKNFSVLEAENTPIGCIHISQKQDHLLVDMILVEPRYQGQGYGAELMRLAQNKAEQKGQPLRLSVLKTNPAIAFHIRCGFTMVEEDEHSCRMQWLSGQD